MKKLISAIMLSILLAHPASAMTAKARYKMFHYCCYWPVEVLTFLVAGPAIVVTTLVQHCDDKLKDEVPVDSNPTDGNLSY